MSNAIIVTFTSLSNLTQSPSSDW